MNPKPLPGAVRAAALTALILTGLSGVFSAAEAMALAGSERLSPRDELSSSLLGDPELTRRVIASQVAALESMRTSRSLVLGGLAVACGLASVASARLLRPRSLSREPLRRLVGGALLFAAVLRTLEGAMGAAVASRVGQAVAPSLPFPPELTDPALIAQLREATPRLLVSLSALHTALVAGAFLFLAQYFRSRRVEARLAELETLP